MVERSDSKYSRQIAAAGTATIEVTEKRLFPWNCSCSFSSEIALATVRDRIRGWMYLWPSTIVLASSRHPFTADRNGQVHTNSCRINESPSTICCWNGFCCFYRTEANICSCFITSSKLAVAIPSPMSGSLQFHILKAKFGKVQNNSSTSPNLQARTTR